MVIVNQHIWPLLSIELTRVILFHLLGCRNGRTYMCTDETKEQNLLFQIATFTWPGWPPRLIPSLHLEVEWDVNEHSASDRARLFLIKESASACGQLNQLSLEMRMCQMFSSSFRTCILFVLLPLSKHLSGLISDNTPYPTKVYDSPLLLCPRNSCCATTYVQTVSACTFSGCYTWHGKQFTS